MNEFTKEELQKLDEVLHWYWYGEKSEISIRIENKIQSMIDVYHDCEDYMFEHHGSCAQCDKCGARW